MASGFALPFSHPIKVAKSSLFFITSSYQRRKMRERSRPVRERQAGKAFAAAAMACCVSSMVDSGHEPMNDPVDGSGVVSK